MSELPDSDLGERLRLLCSAKRIRPAELARRIGVDRAAVCRWMKGTKPRLKHLEMIVEELGMTLVEFYAADLERLRRQAQQREAA